ncbi:MAG: SDR family NAD(P)-dependent oxidoreductase [Rhodoferax sp.]|nr:SDR family NAD(P)-dependent oxidoreductase [Rhodoferax sp.]
MHHYCRVSRQLGAGFQKSSFIRRYVLNRTAQKPRRALITAGANGIGLGIACHDVRIHVCDVDSAALEPLATSEPTITRSVCDVSDREAAIRMAADAVQMLGGLDVLVNNTGISDPTAPRETLLPEASRRQ